MRLVTSDVIFAINTYCVSSTGGTGGSLSGVLRLMYEWGTCEEMLSESLCVGSTCNDSSRLHCFLTKYHKLAFVWPCLCLWPVHVGTFDASSAATKKV